MELAPPSLDKVIVFARIPAESKAKIIDIIKEQFIERYESQSLCEKVFSLDRPKVGMCGDGVNDLLALKEADLSLGIQESDAGFASDFTIQNLLDVDEVLRESKNNVSNIMQVFFYVTSGFMVTTMFSIMLHSNATDLSRAGRIYYNCTSLIMLPFFLLMSSPLKEPTASVPVANFMRRHSQLAIYGNFLIMFLPMVASYIYFKYSSGDFTQTTRNEITLNDGYTIDETDASLFIILNITWTWASFAMYWGEPWKQKYYQNIPMFTLFILNVIASFLLAFLPEQTAEAFGYKAISMRTAGVFVGITVVGVIIQLIFNALLIRGNFDRTSIENQ